MKMKSENGLSGAIRNVLLIFITVFTVLPPAVTAGPDMDIKRNYEGSLFKMTENDLFGIEIKIMEKGPGNEGNKAEIIVYDSSGNDVENAEITIKLKGRETGNGVSGTVVITEKGGGFYSADNILFRENGPREIIITVRKDGTEDTAIFDFPEEKASETEDRASPEDELQEEIPAVEGKPSTAVTYDKYRTILKPLPALPPIPPDNTMTSEKALLGKMLYWERRASKTGTTSCASCHHPSYYGAEPLKKSVGIGSEIYLRNAPTVLNTAFMKALFWAGESQSLEDQTFNAVKSHMEMHDLPEEVTAALNRTAEYKELSARVFGGPLTEKNIMQAIAAFIRTLNTPDYPLARWLQGDESALTENQKKGMALFVDKGCTLCHYGPVFSGPVNGPAIKEYAKEHHEAHTSGPHMHKVILPDAGNDLGLASKSKRDEDKYLFKVPQLLNVAMTPPYTHAGLIDNLPDMVGFMAKSMLNTKLDTHEIDDIAAFLESLTGEMPRAYMSVPLLPSGGITDDKLPGLLPSGAE
ncbi:MAG: c-type cytochrome [Nitrospirae bacterium]|nr:c-type cytochrome [Nitrospirota bacterium]